MARQLMIMPRLTIFSFDLQPGERGQVSTSYLFLPAETASLSSTGLVTAVTSICSGFVRLDSSKSDPP